MKQAEYSVTAILSKEKAQVIASNYTVTGWQTLIEPDILWYSLAYRHKDITASFPLLLSVYTTWLSHAYHEIEYGLYKMFFR